MRLTLTLIFGYLHLASYSFAFDNKIIFRIQPAIDSASKASKLRLAYNLYTPFSKFVAFDVFVQGQQSLSLTIPTMDFQVNGKRVLAQPGDTVCLVLDDEGQLEPDPKSTYSSLYLQASKNELYSVRENPSAYLRTHSLSESEYYEYCLSYFDKAIELVDTKIPKAKTEIAHFLKSRATYSFVYDYLSYSTQYPLDEEIADKKIADKIQFTIGSPPIVVDYSYRIGLSAIAQFKANGHIGLPPNADEMMQVVTTATQEYNKKTAREIILAAMERCINIGESAYIPVLDKIFLTLRQTTSDSIELVQLEEQYRKGKLMSLNLSSFNQLKLFTPEQHDAKPGLLPLSIPSKKLFLIDLWASWCGPCIEEIPALLALQKKYDALQIISISIDKDATKWHNAIKRNGLESQVNFRTSEQALDWFTGLLGELAVPRYLLYDVTGKCISANAPRPSEPALDRMISNLLRN